jgi:hypothetical protein
MTRFQVDYETTCSPEGVVAALTDFTERRPRIWPGLASEYYEVYSVGETTADIREGSTKPVRVWAKEHYDWSTPGTVRWTVQESNFCTPGSGVVVNVSPGSDGGSQVHLLWERRPINAKGRMIMMFMKLFGPRIIGPYSKKALDTYAAGAV